MPIGIGWVVETPIMPVSFERILFPTDFSDLSLAALPHAKQLVDVFHAELHCLHVVDDAYRYWSAMGPESIPVGPPPEDLLKLAGTRMDEFRDEHLADVSGAVVTEVVMGRAFYEIITYARRVDIGLIVMGTHGRGAFAHMLLGSTTEKVVRKASCPVMTVRPPEHGFTMP
jgi:nucleotide-binding universal stress UspA family protein